MPECQVVYLEGMQPGYCVGKTQWGALVCPLEEVGQHCEPGGDLRSVWLPTGRVQWVHLSDPILWSVVPHSAVSPLRSSQLLDALPPKLFMVQTAEPVPLLKYVFGRPCKLTFADLEHLATELGLERPGRSRLQLIESIAIHISKRDMPDVATSFVKAAIGMETAPPVSQVFVDPLTEAAYDALDPEEKDEFRDVREHIQKTKKKARIAMWQSEQKKRKLTSLRGGARRGRGRGRAKAAVKAKAKAKAKAAGGPPQPVPVAADHAAAAAPLADVPLPPAAVASRPDIMIRIDPSRLHRASHAFELFGLVDALRALDAFAYGTSHRSSGERPGYVYVGLRRQPLRIHSSTRS